MKMINAIGRLLLLTFFLSQRELQASDKPILGSRLEPSQSGLHKEVITIPGALEDRTDIVLNRRSVNIKSDLRPSRSKEKDLLL